MRLAFHLLLAFALAPLGRAATSITFARGEVDQMAALWETDTNAISALATAQYPQFTGPWQFIFPNGGISADGDVHVNMAINAGGTGANGNNGGTASPIVAEVINATSAQFNYLSTNAGARIAPRGIFRFYTEHSAERHFELHPATQLLRWNGSAFVPDADYHTNITTVTDGATHAASTYTNLLNGSITMSATVSADNASVAFNFPSPGVNYVEYQGVVVAPVASDAVSDYFLFQPNVVPNATMRCRFVANTNAATIATGLVAGQPLILNSLTRTDMAAVGDQISGLLGGESSTFPRPVEFITLSLTSLGAAAVTQAPSAIATTQATLNGSVNPNGVATSAYFQYGTSTSYGSTTTTQSLGSGSGSVAVSRQLTGLAQNTTYHFRVVATNANGTSYGADRTFLTALLPVPTVTTQSPTSVGGTTATLRTLVNPNGFATSMHFEWGKTTTYGTSTSTQNIGSGTGDLVLTANLTGLKQTTVYHFRAVATNSNGTTFGPDQVFTTTPHAPAASTSAASNLEQTSATLNGLVNPGALSTTSHFDYGLTTSYGSSTANMSAGSSSLDVPVTANLPPVLQAGTVYHFRVVATNSRGTTLSDDRSFTTLPLAPASTTTSATAVGFSFATLQGTVDLRGGSGVAYFEFGPTNSYGTSTGLQSIPAGAGVVNLSQAITGLLANTTYHFRVVGSNASGAGYGGDQMFTTAASAPPGVLTDPAGGLGLTSAILNGRVTANSSPTSLRFEYGSTTAYGFATAWEAAGSTVTDSPFSAALTGLAPNTVYHFRLVAANGSGTTVGGDQTFTTAMAQALYTYTFDDVTSSSGSSSAGGIANNVTFSSFNAIGLSANSSAAGRFSFTNQPLGATNGSDVFTGSPSPAKYYEMSATPAAGYTLNASSMTFTMQRSSTGVRQYEVRGNSDAFAENLTALINPANANLSVVAAPVPNIFQVVDASTSADLGSTIALDSRSSASNTSAAFRFYGFNAEATSGTFSLDDVTIYGLVTAGGVPLLSNLSIDATMTTAATLQGMLNPNGAATTFYIRYGSGSSYGNVTPSQAIGSAVTSFTQVLSGLRSYTTYHFQIIAANSTGLLATGDQTFLTAPGDRDSDGMPDDWEVQHGLNPDDPADAAADADGDGQSNLQEYLAGTDPRDAGSRLRIAGAVMGAEGLEISFTTVPGKTYRVSATDVLPATNWMVIADHVAGTGDLVVVVDDAAPIYPQRFYRLELLP